MHIMFELNFLWIGLVEIFSHFVQGCTGFGATVIQAPVARVCWARRKAFRSAH